MRYIFREYDETVERDSLTHNEKDDYMSTGTETGRDVNVSDDKVQLKSDAEDQDVVALGEITPPLFKTFHQ
jgi:hypothetical protein